MPLDRENTRTDRQTGRDGSALEFAPIRRETETARSPGWQRLPVSLNRESGAASETWTSLHKSWLISRPSASTT